VGIWEVVFFLEGETEGASRTLLPTRLDPTLSDGLESAPVLCIYCVCLLLQYLLQSCSRGGGGEQWRTCATRDYESRPVWTSLPITRGECGAREEPGTLTQGGALFSLVAGPITKLFAWGEEESGGHVL
jgi:hypothetical protein